MEHSFNVEIATKYGMACAVLLKHISFWIAKNKADERNFHDGCYWTYTSVKALQELFPYMSKNTIIRSLGKLEEEGILKTGNYNEVGYDRTKWYAITDLGKSIYSNSEIHLPKSRNGFTQSEKPIPDINTYIETDNISISKDIDCQTQSVRHDIERAVSAWNELKAYGIPGVTRMSTTSTRYKMLKTRITQHGIDVVLKAIESIKSSDFLLGRCGKGTWRITFDWFVHPDNFDKVKDGNYLNIKESNDSDNVSSNTSNHVASSVVVTNNNPVISPIDLSEYDIYGNRRQ